jgi:hypothetical protein
MIANYWRKSSIEQSFFKNIVSNIINSDLHQAISNTQFRQQKFRPGRIEFQLALKKPKRKQNGKPSRRLK